MIYFKCEPDGTLSCLLCNNVFGRATTSVSLTEDPGVMRAYHQHRINCNSATRPEDAALVRDQMLVVTPETARCESCGYKEDEHDSYGCYGEL